MRCNCLNTESGCFEKIEFRNQKDKDNIQTHAYRYLCGKCNGIKWYNPKDFNDLLSSARDVNFNKGR